MSIVLRNKNMLEVTTALESMVDKNGDTISGNLLTSDLAVQDDIQNEQNYFLLHSIGNNEPSTALYASLYAKKAYVFDTQAVDGVSRFYSGNLSCVQIGSKQFDTTYVVCLISSGNYGYAGSLCEFEFTAPKNIATMFDVKRDSSKIEFQVYDDILGRRTLCSITHATSSSNGIITCNVPYLNIQTGNG